MCALKLCVCKSVNFLLFFSVGLLCINQYKYFIAMICPLDKISLVEKCL